MDTTQEDFEHLWDYGKPAETEARFRTELARQPAASESHAQLLTQIARTFSLRRDFAAAHALLDQVAARSDAGAAKVRVRYELERGRTFNSVGDKARAKELFVAAWDHANAAHFDFYAIDAAHMMAFVTPPAEQHQRTRAAQGRCASESRRAGASRTAARTGWRAVSIRHWVPVTFTGARRTVTAGDVS